MKLNRKNKILVLVFILAVYVCYKFAISNTIHIIKEYQLQKKTLVNQRIYQKSISQFQQKEKKIDQILTKQSIISDNLYQSYLLSFLNTNSNKFHLKIIEFKEPLNVNINNSNKLCYFFVLEGSYNRIMLLLNQIENNPNIGYIKHINFVKKRNYKINTDELVSEIILIKK